MIENSDGSSTSLVGTTDRPTKDLKLEGPHIILRGVSVEEDVDELFKNSHGSQENLEIWKYMWGGPYKSVEDFKQYLEKLQNDPNTVAFVVIDKASKRKIGIITFLNIVPSNRSIEIGGIWYNPEFHRTYANTESAYLTMKYAFEELKYRRFEWKCDSLNQRSRNAALRLGFNFEGIFRQHMIVKGRNRDTCWFSILDSEWPSIKLTLEKSINRTNS